MLKGTVVNVEILVGLPGSGKTYYAEKRLSDYSEEHKNKYFGKGPTDKRQIYGLNLDFDKHKGTNFALDDVLGYYKKDEIFCFHPESLIICDGLFLTNDSQKEIVSEWVDLFNKEGDILRTPGITIEGKTKLNIKFIYFKEDREACLSNDSCRKKDRRANITIKHAEFEKPNISEFKKLFQDERITFEIEEREVHEMTKYETFIKKYKSEYYYVHGNYMCSERWSKGGTWGDCWGHEGTIEPDKEPEYFKEFDELIKEYYPDITHIAYRNLYNKCVTIGDDYEADYYGGTEDFAYYRCNLDVLYNYLEEKGKI